MPIRVGLLVLKFQVWRLGHLSTSTGAVSSSREGEEEGGSIHNDDAGVEAWVCT